MKVIIERDERQRIVQEIHEGGDNLKGLKSSNGHVGQDKTENRILERYWWPGIRGDVRSFIASCSQCQRRSSRYPRASESLPTDKTLSNSKAWERVGVDFCDMPQSKEGFTCMIVAVDYFTKWIEAEPLSAKTAENVASFLYHLSCRYGCTKTHLNADATFVNEVSSCLGDLSGFKQDLTSVCDHKASILFDSNTDATQDLQRKLFSKCGDKNNWPSSLPGVLFSLRTGNQASTDVSPFYLLYGRCPKLPADMKMKIGSLENSNSGEGSSQDEDALDSCISHAPQDGSKEKHLVSSSLHKDTDHRAESKMLSHDGHEKKAPIAAERRHYCSNSPDLSSDEDLHVYTEAESNQPKKRKKDAKS